MFKSALLTLILISFISLNAQDKLPEFITDKLDQYVEEALSKWNIPGIAVCIVKDGKVVVSKGYGIRELGTDEKVDENTLFMIASNTKAFVGTALALLEHEGKCSLDDRVKKYLPEFTMKDSWVAENINLTDIITHRMGMETFQGDFMYWTSALTMDQVIEKFGKLTPMYDFRAKWGYTNAGYAVAAKCIEAISGLSWHQFFRKNFFEPLNMTRTLALSEEIYTAVNVAKPHTFFGENLQPIPFPVIDNLGPAGSISSSVKDISNWLIAQLDSGRFSGNEVIPYKVIQKTRQPQSIVRRAGHPFNRTNYSLYALGWNLQDYEGREIVAHTGGANGFVTSVSLVPKENLGVAVFTNTDQNGFFIALQWEIIDSFLELPFRDYSSMYYDRFKMNRDSETEKITAWRDSVNMQLRPDISLDEFTGRYIHDVYGYLDIDRDENTLIMTFEHHPDVQATLESLGGSRFLCTFSDPIYGIRIIPFHIENSMIKSLTLSVDDFVEYTTYDFIKQ